MLLYPFYTRYLFQWYVLPACINLYTCLFSGQFRGVLGCNVEGTRGRLTWNNNWVTFMDCMLQMVIIANDTRGLFVPTRIEKLSVDTNMHYNAISKMNPESLRQSFEVRVYPHVKVIRYVKKVGISSLRGYYKQ